MLLSLFYLLQGIHVQSLDVPTFQTPSWASAAIAVVILAEKFLQCQIRIYFESGPSGMKTISNKMLSFMQII